MPIKHESPSSGSAVRLQKVLAAAGLGSRRDCEDLICQGRVEVDRQVVTELGTRVDPLAQEIRVDGETLRQPKRLYFAVNKPVGVVTTNDDPSGRPRVIDLVPTEERVFAVGRLDRSSEGLILVTNDGEFANRLTHPRYGVEKTYLARVAGAPDQRQLARLKKGVHLAEGFARAQSIIVKKQHGQSTDLIIVLNEGRNREIRRILARVGHKVLALKRIAVGNIKLGDLPLGGWRRLMPVEIDGLLELAQEKRRARKVGASRRERPATQTRSASEGKPRSFPNELSVANAGEPEYLQKQALLAEPLSLDDLLRDDLDEGPLVSGRPDETIGDEAIEMEAGEMTQGGVIDYEDDLSPAAPRHSKRAGGPPRHKHRRGQRHRSHQGGRSGERVELEAQPREDFGKKRGGKRIFSPREQGRGPAAEKAGNFRFRPKQKRHKAKAQARDNQRRGKRRGGQQVQKFGKQGRRRKGRR
jgi:23S rRNA pseudouridine2605 synthase